MLGITNAGTSATDSAQIKTNNAYVWKRTTKFSMITGGWNGETDAWRTAETLANNYESVTGIFNTVSNPAAVKIGNRTKGVFSSATSGTEWLKTCAGITTNSFYSFYETNIFGEIEYSEYNRANMFPMCSDYWAATTGAGVWFRFFYSIRSSNISSYGFRAAAYRE